MLIFHSCLAKEGSALQSLVRGQPTKASYNNCVGEQVGGTEGSSDPGKMMKGKAEIFEFDFPLAAFVLAGGRSSRMGRNKALLRFVDGYLIDYPIHVLRQVTSDVRIIGDPDTYSFLGLPVIPDCVESRGPLSGIYSALKASPSLYNLIVGCDMPQISSRFLQLLLAKASLGDAVMMKFDDGLVEPLCSLYSKDCLRAIQENFSRREYKISEVLRGLKVAYVSESEISQLGLSREIFTNVNTPEDWEKLQAENPP